MNIQLPITNQNANPRRQRAIDSRLENLQKSIDTLTTIIAETGQINRPVIEELVKELESVTVFIGKTVGEEQKKFADTLLANAREILDAKSSTLEEISRRKTAETVETFTSFIGTQSQKNDEAHAENQKIITEMQAKLLEEQQKFFADEKLEREAWQQRMEERQKGFVSFVLDDLASSNKEIFERLETLEKSIGGEDMARSVNEIKKAWNSASSGKEVESIIKAALAEGDDEIQSLKQQIKDANDLLASYRKTDKEINQSVIKTAVEHALTAFDDEKQRLELQQKMVYKATRESFALLEEERNKGFFARKRNKEELRTMMDRIWAPAMELYRSRGEKNGN